MNNPEYVYKGNNMTFSYGKNEVLHNVNFSVPKGKITTLIGANGCGKSTLFQLMTRNLKPDEIIREDLLQEVYGIPLPIHRLDGKKFVSTV